MLMPEFFYQQVIFLKNPFLSILTFQMITVNFNLFTSVPPAESVYSNHYNLEIPTCFKVKITT